MKFSFKSTLFVFGVLLLFNTCTLFKKEITKPVVMVLADTTFLATINSTADYMKYSAMHSQQEIVIAFLTGFKHEAAVTKNITLQYNEANADFILKIKQLTVTESTRTDTIKNEKSPYNGQQVRLNVVECKVEVEITDVKHNKVLQSCTNTKSRSEKEANNRSLDELIAGTNKDKTNYHTKLLADNICLALSEDVGRRIWMPVTRRIAKAIK